MSKDPEHWRSKAEECRTAAEGFRHSETARILIDVANMWDRMAERAEDRLVEQSRNRDT